MEKPEDKGNERRKIGRKERTRRMIRIKTKRRIDGRKKRSREGREEK